MEKIGRAFTASSNGAPGRVGLRNGANWVYFHRSHGIDQEVYDKSMKSPSDEKKANEDQA